MYQVVGGVTEVVIVLPGRAIESWGGGDCEDFLLLLKFCIENVHEIITSYRTRMFDCIVCFFLLV